MLGSCLKPLWLKKKHLGGGSTETSSKHGEGEEIGGKGAWTVERTCIVEKRKCEIEAKVAQDVSNEKK